MTPDIVISKQLSEEEMLSKEKGSLFPIMDFMIEQSIRLTLRHLIYLKSCETLCPHLTYEKQSARIALNWFYDKRDANPFSFENCCLYTKSNEEKIRGSVDKIKNMDLGELQDTYERFMVEYKNN